MLMSASNKYCSEKAWIGGYIQQTIDNLLLSVQTTKTIWIDAKLLTVNLQRQHLQVAMIPPIIVAAAPTNPTNPTDIPMI